MSPERLFARAKRAVVGHPLASHQADHERLSRVTGLAVLSSDPLSSVAYATEEILRVLILAGAGALWWSSPIAGAIATILAIVAFSYRQTIHAYPGGGGAYIVGRENLGEAASLIAAAALLIDYVLTVAVSVAAGVAAITSAFPGWHVNRIELSLAFVGVLMIANLRGVRESGRLFAAPTYFFLATMLIMVGVGAWRAATDAITPVTPPAPPAAIDTLPLFLLLAAFANGCTAMTGVEAVSNGVPTFRKPEARNAAATMVVMAILAITLFMGVTLLAQALGITPSSSETVVSQIARAVFDGRGAMYFAVQAATMLILVLAANTAYAGFPRLSSILAGDRYLPRQLMTLGDRLAFSNGIIGLSVFAALLIVVFGGDTHALIPLYMVGVFVSFTVSQAGMVVHWRRARGAGWRRSAVVSGAGAAVTALVLLVVIVTKAAEGAWIILVLVPLHVLFFRITRRHYDEVASQLSLRTAAVDAVPHNTVIVAVSGLHQVVLRALAYARSLSADVRAVYVGVDPVAAEALQREWSRWAPDVPLVVLESPFRSLLTPLVTYVDDLHRTVPGSFVTVVIPEFLPARWWQHLFHNQSSLVIKAALLFKPNTVVASVPFHLSH